MAHAIDETSGAPAMAYVGTEGKPWHGLGEPIQEGATIKQIEKAARLAWKVERRPVLYQVGDSPDSVKVDGDHQVIFRSDTQAVLDVTGKGYVPHQNSEVLEFFQEYLAAGEMFIDTAGALNGGKQIWVLAKLNKSFKLPGKDEVQGYVMLMNPHQYGKGMIGKMTAVRVVCWNTLMAALGAEGASVKIWHTAEFNKDRQEKVKEQLGIASERFEAFEDEAKILVRTKLVLDDAVKLTAGIFNTDTTDPLEKQGRTVQRVIELYQGAGKGAQLASSQETAWGLLNGVTQYIDHEYGRTQNARLTNAWLGSGDRLKRNAKIQLLEAAQAGG